MKYNPKRNERLAALPGLAAQHPYQDESTLQGLLAILFDLQEILAEIAGLDGRQPAARGRCAGRADGPAGGRGLFPRSRRAAHPGLDPRQRARDQSRLGPSGGLRGDHDQERQPRPGRPRRLQGQAERPDGRVHDHQPQHGRSLRPSDRRDRPVAPRPRSPALPGRRQHECDPRHRPAGRHGGRPDALQPAQDVFGPARRRRPGRGADRRPRRPGSLPPRPAGRSRRRRHVSPRPRSAQVDRPGALLFRQHGRLVPRLLLHPQPGA